MKNIIKSRKGKKGQIEIMGLIVIVVLLTLGFFFMVSLKKEPTMLKEPFENKQISSHFIITFLKTSAECKQYTMEELVQDCAIERKIECEGVDSCTYLNESAKIFLNKTLDLWEYDYNFTIENIKQNVSFVNNCFSNNTRKQMNFQPISLYPYPGTVTVKLTLCT